MVSVIIPAHNRAHLLRRTIQSVINQTIHDFEITVIDDASTDDTIDVIEKIISEYPQRKIRYHRLSVKSGAQAARNRGIQLSNGQWIAFLDSDDEWMPLFLEKMLNNAQGSNSKVVYCSAYRFNSTEKIELQLNRGNGDIYKTLLKGPGPICGAYIIAKECFEKLGYLDESIQAFQEWDTVIRLSKVYNFGYTPDPLLIWYTNNDDSISKDSLRDIRGYLQILEKYKEEIVINCGYKTLSDHYSVLSGKYFSVQNKSEAIRYLKLALDIENLVTDRFIKKIQIGILKYTRLNPKYFDVRIYVNSVKKTLINKGIQ